MTDNYEKARAIFLTVVMVLSMVGSGIAFSGGAAAQTADIIVDASGDGDYTLIQEAVDNAGDTDRIVVEPGTYDESVQISKNITLIAPNGATITNSSQVTKRYGISIYGPVSATVSGFTLTDWQWGVSAGGSEGDWILRDTTMSNISEMAIGGAVSSGDWTVTNVSVFDTEIGVSGYESTGDWNIVDSTFNNVSEVVFADRTAGNWSISSTTIKHSREDAITVDQSTSNWTVSDTSIYDINGQGIDTTNAGGSGIIENTSISHTSSDAVDVGDSSIDVLVSNVSIYNSSTYGIEAGNSSGEIVIESSVINETADHGIELEKSTSNWKITDTKIRNSAGDGIDAYKTENTGVMTNVTVDSVEGNGINLYNATGIWSITDSRITNTNLSSVNAGETTGKWNINRTVFSDETMAVYAVNSTYEGDAAYNYWGASDGPSGDFNGSGAAAVGNLTVSPAYTDSTLSTLTVVSNKSEPVVDATASSVTPTIASPGASQEYRVNVTIALNKSLSDSSGGVDVQFEDFVFDTGEDDLTIDYTAANTSNGMLNVTKTVNATAPSTAGEYAVNVTDLRRDNNDGSVDDIIQDANVTTDNITVVETTWSGSGTQTDPYIITNVSELQDMKYDLDAHYELGNDIDASETATWNDGKGFEPIGGADYLGGRPFTGSLRGANHTVSSLEIHRTNRQAVGLFGGTKGSESSNDGIVKNVNLNKINVSGGSNDFDFVFVGGLVGVAEAPIDTVRVNGSVNGSGDVTTGGVVGYLKTGSIKNTSADVSVHGNNMVGGLAGRSGGHISRASATGSISGDNQVGGLVGYASSRINDSKSTSTVTGSDEVGGLVGEIISDKINTSFAAGSVTGSSNVGGLVGLTVNLRGDAVNSYWDEDATGQSTSDGSANPLITSEMTGLEAETYMPALDFTETWQVRPNDYPALRWQSTSTGDSSAALSGTDVSSLDGTNTTVTFNLENTGETNSSYILNLSLPEGWTAVDYDNAGGDRQDGEAKWLWQTITPNETVAPSVTLEVPENIEGTYTVSGDALSNDSIVAQADAAVSVFDGDLNASLNEQTIGNGTETAITVEAPQSDGSFVDVTDEAMYGSNDTDVATVDANGTVTAKSTGTATLNASYDNRVANVTITVEPATVEEAVDGNNNNQIDDVEILQAITYWQDNDTVPRTDGDTIGDFEILNLIEQWRYNTEL